MLNRQQRRLSESYHKKEIKKQITSNLWTEFEDRTSEAKLKSPLMVKFLVNNLFSIQLYEVNGLSLWGIRRHDQSTNIPWETKQRIKNEVIGFDKSAVEVFPSTSKLVDQANMYWLWEVDCTQLDLNNLRVK